MSFQNKQYDLVVIGASGYTGVRTAQHIARYGPRSLRWAIAGRDEKKLQNVLTKLYDTPHAVMNEPSADQGSQIPAVETIGDFVASPSRLNDLISRTRLVISAVGPYHKLGRNVVAACAGMGVHYVDCTGEVPWVRDMIESYTADATKSGAILIPQCGIDSVPADLLAWAVVNTIRSKFNVGTREVYNACTEISMKPSNGTVSTMLSLLDTYSGLDTLGSMRPFALSPVPNPSAGRFPPITLKYLLTGTSSFGQNRHLIQTPLTRADGSQVGRSWGLHNQGELYGPKFKFAGFIQMPNILLAALVYYALLVMGIVIAIPPLRHLAQKFSFAESTENKTNNRLTYHATGTADTEPGILKQAEAQFEWTGDGYYLTGLLMAEAAFTILDYVEGTIPSPTEALKPGFMTPSTLGQPYVNRLVKTGIIFSSGIKLNQKEQPRLEN